MHRTNGLPPTGMRSLAVSAPDRILTNEHWIEHHPQTVAQAQERIWMWKQPANGSAGSAIFNREMSPYAADPFRGALKRRMLQPDGTALAMEAAAAHQALQVAELEPRDVDLLICTSFLPDSKGIGGATFLAQGLGLEGAAWNLESACSSHLLAFLTACSLVQSGQHRNVLVVSSCTYSRVTTESSPLAWGIGDAAVAMVVAREAEGYGLLGSHSVHSGETCGAVYYDLDFDDELQPAFRLHTGKAASRLLRETSERYLKQCTWQALNQAGVGLRDIDFCIFNTPLAWYASFCARALGIERSRTISLYPLYANIGPALMGINLIHAAHLGRIRKGDLVLLYTVGSVSSCAAAVIRWGEVALGALPAGTSLEELEALEAEAIEPVCAAAA